MRPAHRLALSSTLVAVLVGCAAPVANNPSASEIPSIGGSSMSPSASASASASPSGAASEAPSTSAPTPPSAEPILSEDLGAFSCEMPVVDEATVWPPANIADVRVGTHDGYDRAVWEFVQGLPEYQLDRVTPPFLHDPKGDIVEVAGTSFLRLILRGGTRETVDHTSSWDGPRAFHPDFTTLVDLVEGGDFEAQSTWYLGLSSEACVRVMQLVGEGGTPRLVIDVEH
jgi:hypothetical protein